MGGPGTFTPAVCVLTYMHAYILHTLTHTYDCLLASLLTYLHACTHAHIHAYTYLPTWAYMHICTHECVQT